MPLGGFRINSLAKSSPVLQEIGYTLENISFVTSYTISEIEGSNEFGVDPFFSDDGTKFYVSNRESISTIKKLYYFNLSTPWDISSRSYQGAKTWTSADGIGTTRIQGARYYDDGTKYVQITGGNRYSAYTVSPAYSLNFTYLGTSDSLDQSSGYGLARVKSDNTVTIKGYTSSSYLKSFIHDSANIRTPITFGPNISGNFLGVDINPSGTKIITVDYYDWNSNYLFREWSLSTGWDLSTASQVRTFNYASSTGNNALGGITFSKDGEELICGGVNKKIYVFSLV